MKYYDTGKLRKNEPFSVFIAATEFCYHGFNRAEKTVSLKGLQKVLFSYLIASCGRLVSLEQCCRSRLDYE